MASIQIRNLTFTYPLADHPALKQVNLTVSQSEFIVVCGKSGCGKSTLLRQLKKNLTPFGDREGEVLYRGTEVSELPDRLSTTDIGFVQQNPDNQLVTDKVWHELAFGLESLGLSNSAIRRRVAEMASFFDMQSWFRKGVAELSGGQKQLLNLASVMVMQPKVLILDEPTSQLDPIAAEEFLKTVYKINRDLGTTVIISEHRLEDLIPMADRVVVMDGGRILADDSPWKIGDFLAGDTPETRHPMFYGLPSVMKIYSACGGSRMERGLKRSEDGERIAPLTIRDGRLWLEAVLGEPDESKPFDIQEESESLSPAQDPKKEETSILTMKDVWFQYDRGSEPVLRGLNLDVKEGELFCLMGGNGAGKSTTLKAAAGILKPQRGKVTVDGLTVTKDNLPKLSGSIMAMVPQNPQALFTEITAEEELAEALYYRKIPEAEKAKRVREMLDTMEISHLAKTHPYDLSGGEQQRLALGKILLLEPKLLLLDEPTKGLDPFFKITLAKIFDRLKADGMTLFMVSHDVEFCAQYGDRCAMFFDGEVASQGCAREFFAGNSFYTTTANRIVRQWNSSLVTWEEVAAWAEQNMIPSEERQ
ncbi:MAG: energy-coupling factor transporter ATPase [Firmicutes bacterium]|nr:energy-coupling factor transporter ATPase [Bacillota bacterium]